MSRGSFEFSLWATKQLIQGKFQFRPCLECGSKGYIYVSGDGYVVDRAVEGGYVMECEECKGLCGHLFFEDDL